MSRKPKKRMARLKAPEVHTFDDNLDNLKSSFPEYPMSLNWKLSKGKKLAIIESEDPVATATLFAGLATNGYVSEVISPNGYRRKMADGSVIGLRVESSSDGSPAVDLNIKNDSHLRKIHFIERKKK